jgi:hypothetical protein
MKLTDEQQKTLRAAADRIIPSDNYPSAWQAGVGDYLAKQFEKDLSPFFDTYCTGLASLEAESLKQFEQSFSSLSDEQKDAILTQVEAGCVFTTWTVSPQNFFKLLINTTAEGFYSEPEQGGNRDGVSWAMIGFDATETNA